MAPDLLVLLLAGSATALATGLGAVPVFALDGRIDDLRPLLWGWPRASWRSHRSSA